MGIPNGDGISSQKLKMQKSVNTELVTFHSEQKKCTGKPVHFNLYVNFNIQTKQNPM